MREVLDALRVVVIFLFGISLTTIIVCMPGTVDRYLIENVLPTYALLNSMVATLVSEFWDDIWRADD